MSRGQSAKANEGLIAEKAAGIKGSQRRGHEAEAARDKGAQADKI